jgi:hypothetical protein
MAVLRASMPKKDSSLLQTGHSSSTLQIPARQSLIARREWILSFKIGLPKRERGIRSEERAVRVGTKLSTSDLCSSPAILNALCQANNLHSRKYPKDESTEDIVGSDPTESNQDEFRVGDDEDDGCEGVERSTMHNSEESRQWEQAHEADIVQKPQYGLTGEEFENVWGGEDTGTSKP